MKVLVVSASFPPMPAGEAHYAMKLCRDLVERNFRVDLITTARAGIPRVPGLKTHSIMKRWGWLEMPRLLLRILRSRPDTILMLYLGWLYDSQPMINYVPWIMKRLVPKTRFVTLFFNVLGANEERASRASRFFHEKLRKASGLEEVDSDYGHLVFSSDRIFTLAEYQRNTLVYRFPSCAEKIEIVPSFPLLEMAAGGWEVARDRARRRLGIRPEEFVLANFGYLYPDKGVEYLLHAFQMVRRRVPTARLVFIGGSLDARYQGSLYTDRLFHLARSLGIDSAIIWTGGYSWDSETASQYLYAADACVLPFNWGIALNNSSAAAVARHGLPLISTRGEILEAAFVPDENVVLCPPRDAEALASAILRVWESPELAKRLKAGALSLSEEWFSSEKVLTRIAASLRGAGDRTEGGAVARGKACLPDPLR